MDTAVKTVNLIRASALKYLIFVSSLEETESEQSDVIYHTTVG
jgi:hypothetical protein